MNRSASDDRERGATAVEYAIMATMIAVVIAGAVSLFGIRVSQLFAPVLGAL
jgi:Flp pilus assembly pilin Flp